MGNAIYDNALLEEFVEWYIENAESVFDIMDKPDEIIQKFLRQRNK